MVNGKLFHLIFIAFFEEFDQFNDHLLLSSEAAESWNFSAPKQGEEINRET